MSATELDFPVLASAEQIRRREFASVRRGYDPDQVRDYLEQVAIQVERMERITRETRLEAESTQRVGPTSGIDPYDELASRMSDLLRAADQQAERVRREATEEADRVLAEARADADRIRLDAQSKAEEARSEGEKALRESRERADRTIAGLATKRENLVEQLQTMQERLLAVARDLDATIEPKDGASTRSEVPPSGAGEVPPVARLSDELSTIDPRYEDLWSATETLDITISDIPPLDLGFEELDEPEGEAD